MKYTTKFEIKNGFLSLVSASEVTKDRHKENNASSDIVRTLCPLLMSKTRVFDAISIRLTMCDIRHSCCHTSGAPGVSCVTDLPPATKFN
jgi:hypothetical protein